MQLDLTAAIDTVDHLILIAHLSQYVGIQGTVMVVDLSSSQVPLSCGVPQGSILGLTLFSLYLLPLDSIIAKHNLSFHSYAELGQIYLPIIPNHNNAISSMLIIFSNTI